MESLPSGWVRPKWQGRLIGITCILCDVVHAPVSTFSAPHSLAGGRVARWERRRNHRACRSAGTCSA
eukprot:6171465-Pyramimonas_sp.AAC.1